MSDFLFNEKYKIHYEVMGEGKPLLVLNGIMMSTASWRIFCKSWSVHNKLILVDFLDQGLSQRMDNIKYDQKTQVEVLAQLLDTLGLEKTSVLGISYGGEVAVQFAVKYSHRIDRLIISNAGARTAPLLRDFGYSWNEIAKSGNGRAYYFTTIPLIYSQNFYENRIDWMKKREQTLIPYFSKQATLDALIRLVDSAEFYDEEANLHKITCPTLIIGSQDDALIPLCEQRRLNKGIKGSSLVVIPDCGHASMYEKPTVYASLVLGFVNVEDTEYNI